MRESRFFYLLNRSSANYCSFENRIEALFKGSLLFRSVRNFWNGVRVNFGHCFLVRIADSEVPLKFLDESKAITYFKVFYKRREKTLFDFLATSKITYLLKEIKKEFYAIPVKMGSILLAFPILINALLSIIFKKETSLLNWIIQGLILLIGLGSFSCESDWETIKKGSMIFNKIFK